MSTEVIFSHSGGMFPYYLGIAEVLQQYDLTDVVFSATSGGCFAPIVLNAGKSPREVFNKIIQDIEGNNQSWEQIIRDFLEKEFTEEELLQNNRRLSIKLAKLNEFLLPEKVNVDHWENKEDIVDCVTAACYVPMLCGSKFYYNYRGSNIVDGFFAGTSSLPVTTHKNILFTIDKWRRVSPTWLIPSTDVAWLTGMYELGVMDAVGNKEELLKVLKEKEKILERTSI